MRVSYTTRNEKEEKGRKKMSRIEGLLRDLNANYTIQLARAILIDKELVPIQADQVLKSAFKRNKVSHDVFSYYFEHCSKNGDVGRIEKGIEKAKKEGFHDQQLSWNNFLGLAHIKNNNLPSALQVLRGIAQKGKSPSPYLFIGCINLLKASREGMAQCLELLEEMKKNNVKVSDKTYTNLIVSFSKYGEMETCERLVQKMKDDNIPAAFIPFNTLVGVYGKNKNLEKCLEWIEVMKKEGVKPGWYATNGLLFALVNKGEVERGEEVYEMIKKEGQPVELVNYNLLIDAYGKKDKTEKCTEIVGEMLAAGVKPDAITYNSLISIFARQGDTEMCEEIVEDLKLTGVKPSQFTYVPLFHAYAKKKDVNKSVDLVREMRKEGINPTLSVYSALLDLLGKYDLLEACVEVEAEMKKEGMMMNEYIYQPLLLSFGKEEEEVERCIGWLNEMKQQNIKLARKVFHTLLANTKEMADGEKKQRFFEAVQSVGFKALGGKP